MQAGSSDSAATTIAAASTLVSPLCFSTDPGGTEPGKTAVAEVAGAAGEGIRRSMSATTPGVREFSNSRTVEPVLVASNVFREPMENDRADKEPRTVNAAANVATLVRTDSQSSCIGIREAA